MADSSNIFDNDTSTQRLITAAAGTQVFANTPTDSSYSLDSGDTQDFFRLRVSRSSSFVLTLNSQNADANIALLDSGGVLQDSTNGGTLADAITTDALTPGDYYIRVSLANTNTSTNYTLKVNTVNATRSDLLWRNYSTGQDIVWGMNGTSITSVASALTISDLNWQIQGTADFNGDGVPDYVWRNYSTGQNVVWLMDGNTFRSAAYLPSISDTNWRIEGVGDFDKDGNTDLVWRNYATNTNIVWMMNGTTLKTYITLNSGSDRNSKLSGVADFNGDGNLDLLWRNTQTGQNSIWVMNGISLNSVVSLLSLTDLNWQVGGIGDFNGDGSQDIFWRNYANGQNIVWQMNQTSYVTYAALTTISDLSWRMSASITAQPPLDLAANTMGAAFDIGTLNNSGIYNDKIGGSADTNDYYKFSLTTSGVFNLSLTGLAAGTNANVQIVQDADGNGSITSNSEVLAGSYNLNNSDQTISNLSLTAGTYFIRVYSASTQSSDYALSVSASNAQQIDLALTPSTALTITQTNGQALPSTVSLKSGQTNYVSSIMVNYSVRNNSVSVVPSSFRISFYLSRDNVITTSDYLFGTVDPNTGISSSDVTVNNLGLNKDFAGSQTLTLPTQTDTWWGGDQTYYIGIIIDSGSQVSESVETNNTASMGIAIRDTLQPDLLGGGLAITQSSATPGQALTLTGSIKNIGNKASGTNTNALVQFYFSNDDIFDGGDSVIATAYVKPIAAQSSVSFNSQVTSSTSSAYFANSTILVPDSTWQGWRGNGRYYVVMRTDIFNAAQEGLSRENNVNYGRTIGSYIDYDYIDITGAPNNTPA